MGASHFEEGEDINVRNKMRLNSTFRRECVLVSELLKTDKPKEEKQSGSLTK